MAEAVKTLKQMGKIPFVFPEIPKLFTSSIELQIMDLHKQVKEEYILPHPSPLLQQEELVKRQ